MSKEKYLVHKVSRIMHKAGECRHTRAPYSEQNFETYYTTAEAEARYGLELKRCKYCFK